MEAAAFQGSPEGTADPINRVNATGPGSVLTDEANEQAAGGDRREDVQMSCIHPEPEKIPTDDADEASSTSASSLKSKPLRMDTSEGLDEKRGSQASPRQEQSQYPTIALQRTHPNLLASDAAARYKPAGQVKYLNNLMPIVGFLELTNALDFPANVWNMTPVPTFAIGLMATGGGVSIIASFLAFRDLYKSIRNFKLLRIERLCLLEEKKRWEEAGNARKLGMVQAWLDLNFREALWEAAERMLMDSLNGFAGVLVGVGTILAINGADPASYAASNLLSGYVGNSFNVVYGAANTAFAIYMYTRSKVYDNAIKDALPEGPLKKRLLGHLRKHQIYAIVNGLTVFVAAIGSMVSAKHWEGYVVLIPCVFGAVFGNFFWRHVVGYDRDFCQRQVNAMDLDPEKRILLSIDAAEALRESKPGDLVEEKTSTEILRFMAENGMMDAFAAQVMGGPGHHRQKLLADKPRKHVDLEYERLLILDEDILRQKANAVLRRVGYKCFRDQERMLAELWGCLLAQQLPGRRSSILGPQTSIKEEV